MNSNKVYGLVLSGGKSTRMGADKGTISYHGQPQREYLYGLLEQVCDTTFMSIRKEQETGLSTEYNTIIDQDLYRGPYNGLLSAYNHDPKASWLVLACDLPLINLKALEQLLQERNPNKVATAFALKEHNLPEPLCAIWEAEGLQKSIDYLAEGNGSCPRKFLINADIKIVHPENDEVLLNANFQEDYEQVMTKLKLLK
ncbi:NTP transferase domain-containing protein [Arenibacter sp. 6A1]|uniref:NTP transferase domain-containing protein n=1 Tax=Arenibacter sp. 6A1 TaxID=2720391 RepID=UPI0014462505|nr:NTP transferase domain-containing protein [Arenibacter sp. 6A1]NKI24965.1 NTP transferase domain-containing protein [Arenibacter sp. 6A1]